MNNLAIYIHWPFCKSKCPYCDFNSHVREKISLDDYIKAYVSEIEYFRQTIKSNYISSIFFGGGTPSLMDPNLVSIIIEKLNQFTKFSDDIEITLEANPTSTEIEKFKDFKKAGINRVSLGIQAFNINDLKFLGREHSADEAIKAIEIAANLFNNYSFDLIYARPNQTLSQWENELEMAMRYASKHLSLYQLTIEKGTKFYNQYQQNKFVLPDENLAADLYQLTNDITEHYGYSNYEVSNYAKTNFESKHNLSYWRYDDYLGIGAGAHSRVNNQAIMMIHNPENWLKAVIENNSGIQTINNLSEKEIFNEILLMGLRLSSGVSKDLFYKNLAKNYEQLVDNNKIKILINENLVLETESHLVVTNKGRLVLNKIIEFLSN